MSGIFLVGSAILLLGFPGLAAARRYRATHVATNTIDPLAVGYAGLAVACVALWWGITALSAGRWVLLGAVVSTSLLLGSWPRNANATTRERPTTVDGRLSPGPWLGTLGLLFALLVAVPFLPYGLQRQDRVHRMSMTDWYNHFTVTTVLDATPSLPPRNPYLVTDTEAPYYYGFHLAAAAVHRAAGRRGDLFALLLGLTLITAAAIPLVSFVIACDLGARRAALPAAAGATLLAGFDAIVMAIESLRDSLANWPLSPSLLGFRQAIPSTHIDFWIHHNERQFNAPYVATIWAPHHVAATLIALLLLHLLMARRAEGHARRQWLLPALLLAALPALSAYIAVAVVVGLGGAMLAESVAHRRAPWRTETVRRLAPAAAAASLMALPILMLLLFSRSGSLVL